MSTVRSTAHRTLWAPVQLTVRPITLALAALLVTAALAVAIALSVSNGDDPNGFTKSVRVTPSAPLPPSAIERHQQAGLDGPGMRP